MFKELNDLYQQNINLTVKTMQNIWLDTMRTDQFMNGIKLLHLYGFEKKEESDKMMEDVLEKTRVASKDDINDLVDAQRLVIDLLEDITERIEKLEKAKK